MADVAANTDTVLASFAVTMLIVSIPGKVTVPVVALLKFSMTESDVPETAVLRNEYVVPAAAEVSEIPSVNPEID